jgi:hypothetical protein
MGSMGSQSAQDGPNGLIHGIGQPILRLSTAYLCIEPRRCHVAVFCLAIPNPAGINQTHSVPIPSFAFGSERQKHGFGMDRNALTKTKDGSIYPNHSLDSSPPTVNPPTPYSHMTKDKPKPNYFQLGIGIGIDRIGVG